MGTNKPTPQMDIYEFYEYVTPGTTTTHDQNSASEYPAPAWRPDSTRPESSKLVLDK